MKRYKLKVKEGDVTLKLNLVENSTTHKAFMEYVQNEFFDEWGMDSYKEALRSFARNLLVPTGKVTVIYIYEQLDQNKPKLFKPMKHVEYTYVIIGSDITNLRPPDVYNTYETCYLYYSDSMFRDVLYRKGHYLLNIIMQRRNDDYSNISVTNILNKIYEDNKIILRKNIRDRVTALQTVRNQLSSQIESINDEIHDLKKKQNAIMLELNKALVPSLENWYVSNKGKYSYIHEGIEDVDLCYIRNKQFLIVRTRDLPAYDYKGKPRVIKIPPMEIYIFNDQVVPFFKPLIKDGPWKDINGFDDAHIYKHPHIIYTKNTDVGRLGAGCLGSFGGDLSRAFLNMDIDAIIVLSINFLQQYNSADAAGTYATCWPEWNNQ